MGTHAFSNIMLLLVLSRLKMTQKFVYYIIVCKDCTTIINLCVYLISAVRIVQHVWKSSGGSFKFISNYINIFFNFTKVLPVPSLFTHWQLNICIIKVVPIQHWYILLTYKGGCGGFCSFFYIKFSVKCLIKLWRVLLLKWTTWFSCLPHPNNFHTVPHVLNSKYTDMNR